MTAVLEGVLTDWEAGGDTVSSTSWSGPVRAMVMQPLPGRAQSGSPGGQTGSSGGIYSSAGIYYSQNTNAKFGETGPFVYPQIDGSNVIGLTTVGNDVWNPPGGFYSQALYAANPGQWVVVANFPAGNGAVLTYPSNSQIYNSPLNHSEPFLLQDCTSFYSSFSEVQPYGIPGVASEAAYDTWWNSYANEIMFQHDMVDPSNLRGGFPTIDTAVFGGSYGVPVQNWNLTIFGTEIIWQLADGVVNGVGGIQDGSVDVRAMVNWLSDRGYTVNGLFTGDNCTAIGYGWEISSTNGEYYLYRCNGFTSTYTYSAMETSPGLELYGFTITGPAPGDIINNVTVQVTEYQSAIEAQPVTIQLWDYSGAPAQIGTTLLGARSTGSSNVSYATFYTVTYAQLATLRVRISGNMASGYTESVGGVSLSVNYSVPAPPDSNAGYSISMGMG